jgi:hypothetical protein
LTILGISLFSPLCFRAASVSLTHPCGNDFEMCWQHFSGQPLSLLNVLTFVRAHAHLPFSA